VLCKLCMLCVHSTPRRRTHQQPLLCGISSHKKASSLAPELLLAQVSKTACSTPHTTREHQYSPVPECTYIPVHDCSGQVTQQSTKYCACSVHASMAAAGVNRYYTVQAQEAFSRCTQGWLESNTARAHLDGCVRGGQERHASSGGGNACAVAWWNQGCLATLSHLYPQVTRQVGPSQRQRVRQHHNSLSHRLLKAHKGGCIVPATTGHAAQSTTTTTTPTPNPHTTDSQR
jgi:hypothetical protein